MRDIYAHRVGSYDNVTELKEPPREIMRTRGVRLSSTLFEPLPRRLMRRIKEFLAFRRRCNIIDGTFADRYYSGDVSLSEWKLGSRKLGR